MTATRSSDPQAFETLLRAVVRAARSGNLVAARALAHALTSEFPDQSHAWVALAGVSETPQEQRTALEHAQALDPGNEKVQRALERLTPASVISNPPVTDATPASALSSIPAEPIASTTRNRSFGRWLVFLLLLLLLLPTLGYAMTVRWRQPSSPEPVSTPTLTDSIGGATGAKPTTIPVHSPTVLTAPSVSATRLPSSPVSTVSPQLVPSPAPLAPGAMVALDGWHASLPRQDYALVLDGGIGDIAPRGHFVLAVVALANTDPQPRTLPPNLFVLIDNRGHTYAPQPSLSSAYLAAYGRAQRGDLSMEDAMPGGGGYFSVPIVFDVPLDATGLRLSLGDGSVGGWEISGA